MRLLLELKLEDCIFLHCGAFVPNHKQQSVGGEAMRDEILGSKLPKTTCAEQVTTWQYSHGWMRVSYGATVDLSSLIIFF